MYSKWFSDTIQHHLKSLTLILRRNYVRRRSLGSFVFEEQSFGFETSALCVRPENAMLWQSAAALRAYSDATIELDLSGHSMQFVRYNFG